MEGKTQINFWVEDEKKEEWEQYLEETNDSPTLSHLIRTSVQEHISSEGNDENDSSPALASDIQKLGDQLSEMKQDVSWIRQEMQDDVDISDLAQDVYDELVALPQPQGEMDVPEGMEESEYRKQIAARQFIMADDMEELESEGESPQTARAIAERVGTTDSRVKEAIDHLKDQFLPIEEIEIQNEVHYFKGE